MRSRHRMKRRRPRNRGRQGGLLQAWYWAATLDRCDLTTLHRTCTTPAPRELAMNANQPTSPEGAPSITSFFMVIETDHDRKSKRLNSTQQCDIHMHFFA